MITAVLQQLVRLATWTSQGINVWLLWVFGKDEAHPDLTTSARCYVEGKLRGKRGWDIARRVINFVFFFQTDHCKQSFDKDIEFTQLVSRWLKLRGEDKQ